MKGSEAKTQIQEIVDLILLGDEVCSAVEQAKSFVEECGELRKRVSQLVKMLETLFCSITSFDTAPYLRPVKCVVPNVKDNFKQALDIVNKCQNQSFICRVLFTCSNATQFRNLFQLLDASIMDMQCLVTVYDLKKEAIDPRIKESPVFLVWSFIASVQMGRQLGDRVDAAKNLALLAQEKEEYKEIIFEEGGVPPLLKLFKKTSSPDAQITVANALCLLANDEERTEIIMKEMISAIVNRLSRTSPVMDQIEEANLVAAIAKNNVEVKEYDLMRENVIWRLITLLSSEPSADDHRPSSCQLKLKISCSKALLMLASGSVLNCTTLTETKGMLCLAKLVESERDELQYNCLMIIREITEIAESNHGFRRSAFNSSSPAAKAVVDELLRVIEEFDEAKLRIPAIKSIGSLARSFSAKESRVISPLVAQLDNADQQITTEAAVALNKFVCSENHLSEEHSKSIIEFGGIPLLMKLLRSGDKKMSQPHGLALICYLAKHGGNSNVLIKAGALAALETTGRLVAAEHPELEELVSAAITKLQSDQTEAHEEFDSSSKGSIKQFITEQSKLVSDFLGHRLKLLLEGPIVYLPRLVNLQIVRTTSEIVMRCKKRFLQAQRCFPTRRIKQFLKPRSLELALRSVMDYPGPRVVAKEITGKLKEVKKIVKSFRKKEIRRKFGYIVHKFRFWKIVTFLFFFENKIVTCIILPWLI